LTHRACRYIWREDGARTWTTQRGFAAEHAQQAFFTFFDFMIGIF
jgi:hypothetical protein